MVYRASAVWLSLVLSLSAPPTLARTIGPRDKVPEGFYAAPYYPTPHGGWLDSWKDAYAKAHALVSRMTLAEKTNITSGVGIFMGMPCVGNTGSADRLSFPQLCLQDSALGVASADNVTAFPPGITTGATWDKALMYARGVAIGREFRGKGANVHLGPSVGPIGRKPLGGRNWEGFGADPVLQAKAAALHIKGVQEQGVIATVKHLIGNEQEMFRMYNPFQPGYSANIDDRTLHELYLWPFAEAVHAGVGAVMTAYNAVNGSASSQNSYLINGLLKDELGFQGMVMSDWLSHISGVGSALAGLDLNMPGDTNVPLFGFSLWQYELTRSVLNGSVPLDRLNDMATRVVAAWYKMRQDKDFPRPNFSSNTRDRNGLLYPAAIFSPIGQVNWFVNVQEDHYKIARQVAQDAITLLKNDGSLLPLTGSGKITVFGTGAQVNPAGPNACLNRACNKGTLGMGWGSGVADYPYFDDPITAIRKRVPDVEFHNSDEFPLFFTGEAPAPDDVAVVFISSDAGENSFTVENNHGDRDADKLAAWHGGDGLVKKVADKFPNVVVVAHTVGPLILEPWIDHPSVKAVLFAHLPGQEAGESLAGVLFGDVSPSGHLPYSITRAETDYPDSIAKLKGFTLGQVQDTYSEGLYIDYRWLNKRSIKPRFAFGHGLSYTTFAFTNATIRAVTAPLDPIPPPRPSKLPTPSYPTDLPAASEAYYPDGFKPIWRYLYSWLPKSEADAAWAIGATGKQKYAYPDGYSTTQKPGPAAGGGEGGHPALWDVAWEVDVTKKTTGGVGGPGGLPRFFPGPARASVQAYVQYPPGIPYDTPPVQLRDFEKTPPLAPGESQTVTLRLTRKDVSVWDVELQNWVVPGATLGGGGKGPGRYTIWIGEASDQLFLACYTDTGKCEQGLEPPV
ncbi:glycoside hydrolase family 3 protein [Thermothelomyces thermophilus ATCC 42464]|uniref:beta-glucosidase n=1 Tax=Thermothelomyces thermophilus (strain ATCC 42464 / BCRC 31852 / DSM 1799) TaxID=573729 RepID=G2Q8I9_THET4|nr:glycoside hydrolase family 3 protein [Thermothelomyces thermophilus ATCC 42464]AEO56238.1 glycoside hydrolase family 3 protein [Thermothelomyces thermophilus ATCC 42464]UUA81723.1 beta-glucosidase [synthetic construct]